jgi:dihydroxy-acid dehydratase
MAILGELDRVGLIDHTLASVHNTTLGEALDHWDVRRTRSEAVQTLYRAAPGGIPTQGNRISELGKEVDEIIVIPSCDLEFPTEGGLPGILAHDVESHVAQHGEILRSIVHTVSGPIFLHDDIKAPMEAICHTPVRPGDGIRSAESGRLSR